MTAAVATARAGTIHVPAVEVLTAPADLDAIALYAAAGTGPRWLWVDGDHVQVGLGAACTVTAEGPERFGLVSEALGYVAPPPPYRSAAGAVGADVPAAIWVGGFAFEHRRPVVRRPPWPEWPSARLVLPTVTYLRRGHRAWWLVVEGDDPRGAVAAAAAAGRSGWQPQAGPLAVGVADPGHDDVHERLVAQALPVLESGELAKVVVARCFDVDQAVPEATLLRRLSLQHRDCVTFSVGDGPWAFLGATPERLVSVQGDHVHTAAIAGTVRRGGTQAEDRCLAGWLRNDDKERREHDLVVEDIEQALARAGVTVRPRQPTSVLTLSGCHHLHTPVDGRRRDAGTTVVDLAGVLHPTPAVAGTPTSAAVQWIRDHEHMDRGWYAAPVGWVDASGQGEFRVALRSALCGPERTHLFAGGGIVIGSDPGRELAETAVKLQAVLAPILAS